MVTLSQMQASCPFPPISVANTKDWLSVLPTISIGQSQQPLSSLWTWLAFIDSLAPEVEAPGKGQLRIVGSNRSHSQGRRTGCFLLGWPGVDAMLSVAQLGQLPALASHALKSIHQFQRQWPVTHKAENQVHRVRTRYDQLAVPTHRAHGPHHSW